MPDAGIFRRATHGMTPAQARAWFLSHPDTRLLPGMTDNDLGPALPYGTNQSGRCGAGRKGTRKVGPRVRERICANGDREYFEVREYYHQGGLLGKGRDV